jgi:hypothetical protein
MTCDDESDDDTDECETNPHEVGTNQFSVFIFFAISEGPLTIRFAVPALRSRAWRGPQRGIEKSRCPLKVSVE